MSLTKKLLLGTLVALLVSAVAFMPLLWLGDLDLSSGLCGEDLVERVYSTTKTYYAATYVRNCGATTGFVSHVNIHRSKTRVHANKVGVIDDGEVLVVAGEPYLEIKWTGPRSLEIRVESTKVFKKLPSFDGVRILYPPMKE